MTPRRPSCREAIGRTLVAMLERMDLLSKRVGTPRSDGYVLPPGQQGPKGRELDFGLVHDTGLSITKVRRAISEAVRAGWLLGPRKGPDGRYLPGPSGKRYQRVEEYTDHATGEKRYCAHRVVYVFTRKFFEAISMTAQLERAQAAAQQRKTGRAGRFYAAALLKGRDLVRGMRRGSREERPRNAPATPVSVGAAPAGTAGPPGIDAAENAARTLAALRLGLRQKHPDWGAERLTAEARRLLGR
jgi:hypothetical protein